MKKPLHSKCSICIAWHGLWSDAGVIRLPWCAPFYLGFRDEQRTRDESPRAAEILANAFRPGALVATASVVGNVGADWLIGRGIVPARLFLSKFDLY